MLTFSLVACSNNEIQEPDNTIYRRDIQEYIVEILDSTATISIFEKVSSERQDDTLLVTCVALYSGSVGKNKGTFTLNYSSDGKEWVLEKCHVELDETVPSQEQLESTEEENVESTTTESVLPDNTEESTQPSSPSISVEQRTYAYTLTEIGKIKDSDRDITVRYDPLLKINGETAEILNYMGQKKNDLVISGIEYLGNCAYAVRSTEKEINSVGLISQEGEVLISFEACNAQVYDLENSFTYYAVPLDTHMTLDENVISFTLKELMEIHELRDEISDKK